MEETILWSVRAYRHRSPEMALVWAGMLEAGKAGRPPHSECGRPPSPSRVHLLYMMLCVHVLGREGLFRLVRTKA